MPNNTKAKPAGRFAMTKSTVRPAAKRSAKIAQRVSRAETKCPAVSPVSPGVMLVVVRDQSLLYIVRAALEYQALIGGQIGGLPLPKVERMISILTGNHRVVEAVKLAAGLERLPADAAKREFKQLGRSDDFDLCREEALCTVLPIVRQAAGWVTASLSINALISPHVVGALERYRSSAKRAGTVMILFVECPVGKDISWLKKYCDEYVEAGECEPDPATHYAFSIEAVDLKNIYASRTGKMMCSVTLTTQGCARRYPRFDPAKVNEAEENECDSGGFYWVYKHHAGHRDINRIADQRFDSETIGKISVLVNGGGNGYFERQAYSQVAARQLTDDVSTKEIVNYAPPTKKQTISVDFSRIK